MSYRFDQFDWLLGNDSPQPINLETLSELPQWVAWREVSRDGKPSKVPFDPNRPNQAAKANDRSTWGTQEAAAKAVTHFPSGEAKRGIGLQLSEIDGISELRLGGIDLDSCLDPDTGKLAPWAAEVLARFPSYAEVSPGGKGIKIFFTYTTADAAALAAAMRDRSTGKNRHRISWSRGTHYEIGLDVSNRYYTVTFNHWPSTPDQFLTVSLQDFLWLINEAGPAFKSFGQASDGQSVTTSKTSSGCRQRDESGSGYGLRFLLDHAVLGYDKEKSIALLLADDGPAGEWARRSDERQHERAWKRANEHAQARRPIDPETAFEDLPDVEVDPTIARLNRHHAFVMAGAKGLIAHFREDRIDLGAERDLHARYKNDRVPGGYGRTIPASQHWMKHPQRRQYLDGITFAPGGCGAGTLNLWRGWAVEPDPAGSCELFLDHVRTVVCKGNAKHAAYLLGWLAHLVQRPEEKPGVALILRGAKGAGKDTVADYVARMIGRRHAPTVAVSEHIVGRFNARLENALLLHVQEGSWAGDKNAENHLKYMVTSDFIEIERKGIDSINLPSVLRLFISANASWVVLASHDERRWAIFEVSDSRCGDEAYFTALRAERDGSGPAALLHFLRSYDLTGFNVRKAPASDGLRDQKLASLRNVYRWWFNVLNRGAWSAVGFDEIDWEAGPQTVGREALRREYIEWLKDYRYDGPPVDESRFGRALKEMLPSLGEKRPSSQKAPRHRQYVLPPLGVARTAFDSWLKVAVDWDSAQ